MIDEHQLVKELTQIRGRIGVNDHNIPNGNGLLNRIEKLEAKVEANSPSRLLKQITTVITMLVVLYSALSWLIRYVIDHR